MATGPSSLNVLGNNSAMEIRDIPGRAIWNKGNSFIEVQTPLIGDDEIRQEIDILKKKASEVMNFQNMFELNEDENARFRKKQSSYEDGQIRSKGTA